MKVGKTIKEWRKKRGLSQKELADKTGISLSSIKKYELELRVPKLEQLIKIADVLDMPLYELINDIKEGMEPEMDEKQDGGTGIIKKYEDGKKENYVVIGSVVGGMSFHNKQELLNQSKENE